MNYHAMIKHYGLISDQVEPRELKAILGLLENSLAENGAIVEFGCYSGTTSLFIERVLKECGDAREFHVYDSFAGLPEKSVHDVSPLGEQFVAGELAAAKKVFLQNFKKAGLRPPHVHKAWFSELTNEDVPDKIRFAFLDGDYYESIKVPLSLITPILARNATIIVDDYGNDALPGARKAVDEWAKTNRKTVREIHSLAVIQT